MTWVFALMDPEFAESPDLEEDVCSV